MDIISIVAALPLLVNVASTLPAEAKETVNTNTKIEEVETKKESSIDKSEEELKNEKILPNGRKTEKMGKPS